MDTGGVLTLAALGVGAYLISSPPKPDPHGDVLLKKSESDAAYVAHQHAEDLLLGQHMNAQNGALSIDTGFEGSYLPKGRPPYGASMQELLQANSRAQAEYTRARNRHGFRVRAHPLSQYSAHLPPQIVASASDGSVNNLFPHASGYPFVYSEGYDQVYAAEHREGGPARPLPHLTGVAQTFANNDEIVLLNQAKTAEGMNPYTRRGAVAYLSGGAGADASMMPVDRTQEWAVTGLSPMNFDKDPTVMI